MKTVNEYQQVLEGKFYEGVPKAVLAAIAVSLQARLDGGVIDPQSMTKALRDEWNALYQNGIIPQKPRV